MTRSGSAPPPTPRPVSPADRKAFDTLADQSLPAVRSMVAAWRTGLTGVITLVTTGIILTGRTATTDLTPPWLAAVTVAIGGGLACAIIGLWHALAAEVGSRTTLASLDDILARHASVQAYRAGIAVAAGRRLQTARALVAAGLALLLTGVILTWWAPPAPKEPPASLSVTRAEGTVCGTLNSADGGVIRITPRSAHDPIAIPLISITNLSVSSTCS